MTALYINDLKNRLAFIQFLKQSKTTQTKHLNQLSPDNTGHVLIENT